MDCTTLNKFEKTCKKIYKVLASMVAVSMAQVLDVSLNEVASIQVHCFTWARDRLIITTKMSKTSESS